MGKKWNAMIFVLIAGVVMGAFAAGEQEGTEAEWPTKSITMAIGYSAGGSTDVVTRGLAREMQDFLGENITCVNVSGAGASIAGQQVLDAPSDGYMMFAGVAHSPSGWRVLDYADIGWEDFYGFHCATSPYVLFVSADSDWMNISQLVDAMEAEPGKIKWGSAGLGSMNHVTGTVLLDLLGTEATHIPYQGGREAATKLMAGDVDFSWAGLGDIKDLAAAGKVRILGIAKEGGLELETDTGVEQIPALIDDYPQLSAVQDLLFWGVAIPRDTPAYIVSKYREAYLYAVEQDRFKELCESRGLMIVPYSGVEDDKLCANLESVYTWGLYAAGMAAVSPAEFDIPRVEDYSWPPHERAASANPWPEQ